MEGNARTGAQSRIARAIDKTDGQFTRHYTVVLRTALLNSCLAAKSSLSVGSPVLPSRVWVAMAIRTTNPASVALSSSFNLASSRKCRFHCAHQRAKQHGSKVLADGSSGYNALVTKPPDRNIYLDVGRSSARALPIRVITKGMPCHSSRFLNETLSMVNSIGCLPCLVTGAYIHPRAQPAFTRPIYDFFLKALT